MTDFATVVAVLGVVGTFASVFVAAWEFRRKTHLEIFCAYTKKYNEIIRPEIYADWQAALEGDQKYWEKLKPVMIQYLNLIWEEAYLREAGIVPDRIWSIWEKEIKPVLKAEFTKRVLKEYKFHYGETWLKKFE